MVEGVTGSEYRARGKKEDDDTIEDSLGYPSSPSISREKQLNLDPQESYTVPQPRRNIVTQVPIDTRRPANYLPLLSVNTK
jgi:hypothetical protein